MNTQTTPVSTSVSNKARPASLNQTLAVQWSRMVRLVAIDQPSSPLPLSS